MGEGLPKENKGVITRKRMNAEQARPTDVYYDGKVGPANPTDTLLSLPPHPT
jgi:hypothetical protein